MQTVQAQILDRISRQGRGKVFTPKDFLDLGSREAADQALSRLAKAGNVERLARGLYYFPAVNARLQIPLRPDADEIAAAIGRRTGSRAVPSGAVAANRLGLITQVPARPVYLTDGRTRQVRVGGLVLQMRHVAPKELPAGNRTSALVFQALRHLGRAAINDAVVRRLRRSLSPQQLDDLRRDAQYTTEWIAEVVHQVVAEDAEGRTHG